MSKKDVPSIAIPPRESEVVEFRRGDAPVSQIVRDVCAFLNSNGGRVFVGVGELGEVSGVDDATNRAKEVRAALQESLSPSALWSVGVDEVGGKQIVMIEVPAGQDRPYVCDGAIYVRQVDRTTSAKADAIHRMIEARHRTPWRWERQPAAGFELADLDTKEVDQTVEEIRERGRIRWQATADIAETLYALSLLQSGRVTNACAVLFSTNPCRRLPQTRVRATAYATDKGGDYLDNRLFEGHLFSLLSQLMGFFDRNVRVVSEFEPGHMARSDRPEYPFAALREGLMNALAHRDYGAFDGGMSVGVFPDRIEIWNSGSLPPDLTVGALKRPHPSRPPNPDIAHILYLRGLIERIGRGTIKIVEECKAAKLPAPLWKADKSGVTLTLRNRAAAARARALNTRQVELLSRLPPGAELRPGDYYAEMEGVVGQRQAQRDLARLEAGGWLRQQGEGKATVYVRTDQEAP